MIESICTCADGFEGFILILDTFECMPVKGVVSLETHTGWFRGDCEITGTTALKNSLYEEAIIHIGDHEHHLHNLRIDPGSKDETRGGVVAKYLFEFDPASSPTAPSEPSSARARGGDQVLT